MINSNDRSVNSNNFNDIDLIDPNKKAGPASVADPYARSPTISLSLLPVLLSLTDATFPCRFAASPAPSLPTPNRAASPLRFPPTLSPNREEGSVPCSAWLHGFPACWSLSGDSEPEVECFLMVFFDGGGREREGQDGGGGGGGYQRGH